MTFTPLAAAMGSSSAWAAKNGTMMALAMRQTPGWRVAPKLSRTELFEAVSRKLCGIAI